MFDKASHLLKGSDAEKQAASFLKEQGLKVIAKNQRYKAGEIDIIAKDTTDKDTEQIIFVEVKYRKSNDFGHPQENVTLQKQHKLRKAANIWIQEQDPNLKNAYRFDVISFEGDIKTPNWIKDAF